MFFRRVVETRDEAGDATTGTWVNEAHVCLIRQRPVFIVSGLSPPFTVWREVEEEKEVENTDCGRYSSYSPANSLFAVVSSVFSFTEFVVGNGRKKMFVFFLS